MSTNLNPETVREFLNAFEEVFDRDWAYTKEMLVSLRVPMPIIDEEGTFVHPKAAVVVSLVFLSEKLFLKGMV